MFLQKSKEGDSLNLGVMYGDYATHSLTRPLMLRFCIFMSDGRAIVELKRKGIKAGGVLLYDTDNYSLKEIRQILTGGKCFL